MFDLPRESGPDAVDLAGRFIADGMVSRLSSPPGEIRKTASRGVQHGLGTAGQPAGNGNQAGEGISNPGLCALDWL